MEDCNENFVEVLLVNYSILVDQLLGQCPHQGVSSTNLSKLPCLLGWDDVVLNAEVVVPFLGHSQKRSVSIELN